MEEAVEGEVGIPFCLIQEADEFTADDGTGGVSMSGCKGLAVADAETDHTRVSKMHIVDTAEVLLLCLIEIALGSRDGGAADHIDEAVGIVVDEADTLVAGLRGDEHDDAQVITICHRLDHTQIVVEGQVGDNHAADAHLGATLTECFDAEMEDGIEVAHEDERCLYLPFDGLQLREERFEVHTVREGFRGGTLNDGTVGQRVAEGNADLDAIDASTLHREDDVGRAVEGGSSGAEVEREELAVATVGEELVDLIHND